MKIVYRKGNLLDVTEGIIVHGCNMQGVMGAGVAKAIKEKYPECFNYYIECLPSKKLGQTIWYDAENDVGNSLYIVNALTQEKYGTKERQVNYVAIANSFQYVFRSHLRLYDVHFPKIGAGLGGGDWNIIEQIIIDAYNIQGAQCNLICWEL